MHISIDSAIHVSRPTAEIKDWCERELKIPNPVYQAKVRMNKWVGNTPKYLYLYKEYGYNLELPYGVYDKIAEMVNVPIDIEWNAKKYFYYPYEIPLYDYQQKAVDAMWGAGHGILQSRAGSGKTQMGLALILKQNARALWLTNTLDLLKQSRDRAMQYIDSSYLGTISEGRVSIGKGITFATIQTMSKLNLEQYRNLWDVIIVDECHKISGAPASVTMFYQVLSGLNARHKYGLSATVHRADGTIKCCKALLGDVMYVVPDEDIDDKIMTVTIEPIGTDIAVADESINTDGTLDYPTYINNLARNVARNDLITDYLIGNIGHSCLILSDRIDHLSTLMDFLPKDMRDDAVMVTGRMTNKTAKAERVKAIEDMRNGSKKYLFATYQLAGTGLDIPRLDRLFLAMPQRDYAVVTQAIGRIARKFDGKEKPVCYDFVDADRYTENLWRKRRAIYRKNKCIIKE